MIILLFYLLLMLLLKLYLLLHLVQIGISYRTMQLLMPSGSLILGTIRRRYFLIRGDNLLLMLILLLSGRGSNRPLLLMTLVSCS